jgi:cell wall-associated NlpC family hydrolase
LQNEIVITGEDVIAEARTWLGTPFAHQQAAKDHGCDCIGMVRGVGRDLEIMDFDEHSPEGRKILAYPMTPSPKYLIASLNYWFIRVRQDFEIGDVVLFAIANTPTHVGLVSNVSKGEVIHTWLQKNEVVETRYGEALRPTGIWRYPGVAYPGDIWDG